MKVTKEKIEKLIPKLRFKFPYSVEDYVENLYLENYHSHTDFSNTSVPDCAESIENYAERIKKLGSKCLYSGEHGNQGNAFEVYTVAEENNLFYRHSAEAYWVKDRLKEYPSIDKNTGEYKKDKNGNIVMSKDRSNCHIILVAKNDEGRKDLNFALSIANEDGYYYQPRLDMELLLDIPKDNMIITSACLAGWKYEDAEEYWLKLANHFGDNFFVELQYHNTPLQKKINQRALDFAKKYNLQIICGLDSHYVKEENSIKRDQIQKYKNVHYDDEDGWYMDYPDTKEVIRRFEEQGVLTEDEILLAIMNTNVFVNECEEIKFDRHFKIPSIYKNKTYEEKVKIYKRELNAAYKKEKLRSKEKANGIRWEAEQIIDSHTVDYFLTSKAIIDKAVHEYGGILTTTSRGSAASFVTNKLLGLTTVDRFNAEIPIYPERFLTKERVLAGQMPDIDSNLANPDPFVKAARDLLGYHGVYPLMAIEKLKEKAAWQLFAGINDVKPEDANKISKFLDEYNKKLKHTEEEDKHLIHVEDFIPEEYLSLYRKSLDYQGITINLKVHACFPKGHIVLTSKGYKEIEEVSVGDYVLTHNNKYEQVLAKHINKAKELCEIKIVGDNIVSTPNHPFYVRTNLNKTHRKLSEPYWKQASDITTDDWVGAPINQNAIIPSFKGSNKTYKKKENIDFSDGRFWWIVGRYMGDGWCENPRDHDYRIIICCSKKSNELEDICSMIPDYFNYRIDEHRTSYKITMNNKYLYDYLSQFGKYAYGKKLTGDIIDLPVYLLRYFLDGYMSADGSLGNEHTLTYTFKTVSRDLAYGLQQCFQKVYHMPCTINIIEAGIDVIEGRSVNRRKKYCGKIKLIEKKKDVNKFIDGMVWYKVRRIRTYEENCDTYNLSVNNDNSYTVNNFAVHNCGNLIIDGDIRREIGLITAVSETTGKRTLCAAVEGKYLDDFGYVKQDFLIVDSSHLTYKLFHSIGENVPSFEDLREMVDNDQQTWDVYAKGITCCVNQCEKESTTNKVKKYKPKTIAELAAFIAGIRPGFASLINTFLNRENYSTGEAKIDELLNDSAHYMIYQESIMKVLSFLGLPMSETYGVIKSISKKKLKGEKKEHLLSELKESWLKIFGNLDNFNNVWKVIEDSAAYAFNAPHAYSMAGDSLYQAWFKAHHTAKFYEVAITHYQEKNKKDKIDALVKEAMKFYGFKLGNYEFGKDNRKVNIDEKEKIIYPNLSSVKGFGEVVVNTLYEAGELEYESFIDVLKYLSMHGINKTIIENLIKIDYFKKFGGINTLLKTKDYFELLDGTKQMNKTKILENGLDIEIVKKYGNETPKQINKIDSKSLLNELVKTIPYRELTTKEKLTYQLKVLGIVTYVDPSYSKRCYFVTETDVKKSIVNITLYEIYSGVTRNVKMWRSSFDRNPFDEKDIITIYKLEKKNKRERTGEVDPNTGKAIYAPVEGEYEFWLQNYSVEKGE